MGLGQENQSPAATFKWSDQFWVNVYNNAAKKFKDEHKQTDQSSKKKRKNSSVSASGEKNKKKSGVSKKKRDVSSDSDSSDGEFDGNLFIQKSSVSLVSKAIKKTEKKADADKSSKKGDKKEKAKRRDSIASRLRSRSPS